MRSRKKLREEPIDFVVTWVDGGDVEWLKKKSRYQDIEIEASIQRYRDWGLFKYWFRSVERHAPWVNRIFVVTDDQTPEFLNIVHPKLRLVSHKDFISEEYLPTFSSHVIENNLHRIEGLSDKFVYFNDDMYLNRDVKPTDFFKKGKPCYALIERPLVPALPMGAHNYASINDMAVINKYFTRKDIVRRLGHFLNPRYGKSEIKNALMLPWHHLQHFEDNHMPVPYLKSTFEEVWALEPELLNEVSKNKFRTPFDVNHFLFRYWDLARGNFTPYRFKSGYYSIGAASIDACLEDIRRGRSMMICLNDGGDVDHFEQQRDSLRATFRAKYPEKSQFEL